MADTSLAATASGRQRAGTTSTAIASGSRPVPPCPRASDQPHAQDSARHRGRVADRRRGLR
jgi:hypothetical protein